MQGSRMTLRKRGGLNRALMWRYTLVTTAALLIVELLVFVVMTRLAPPYTFGMQPDVYLIREFSETIREYMLAEDYAGLEIWLRDLRQPVVNVTFDDNWLRLNLATFPVRGQQTLLIFREGDGVLAVTPPDSPFANIQQIEELPGPLDSDLLRYVPVAPGDNIVTTRNGNQVLSVFPIQDADGTLLGLFIVLNFASGRPPSAGDVLLLAGGSTLVLMGITAILGGGFGYLVSRLIVRRLSNLVSTTANWGVGDFSQPVRDEHTNDELTDLAYHLNHLRTQIQEAMTMREQLAIVEERSNFARELHDSVKQQVFTLRMNLATIDVLLDQETSTAQPHLQKAISLAQSIQDELTLMIGMFRAQTLPSPPLAERFHTLLTEWRQHTEIRVNSDIYIEQEPFLRVSHTLYRVAQEALANVQKHSGATLVHIQLSVTTQMITLDVQDNGTGFDVANPGSGFGLLSMRERVEALGGAFAIVSNTDGTSIQVQVLTRKDS